MQDGPAVRLPNYAAKAGILLEWRKNARGEWEALVYWTAIIPGYKGGLDPQQTWFRASEIEPIRGEDYSKVPRTRAETTRLAIHATGDRSGRHSLARSRRVPGRRVRRRHPKVLDSRTHVHRSVPRHARLHRLDRRLAHHPPSCGRTPQVEAPENFRARGLRHTREKHS